MKKKKFVTTTFQLTYDQRDKVNLICHLCHISMGEFIRSAIFEKLQNTKLKVDENLVK